MSPRGNLYGRTVSQIRDRCERRHWGDEKIAQALGMTPLGVNAIRKRHDIVHRSESPEARAAAEATHAAKLARRRERDALARPARPAPAPVAVITPAGSRPPKLVASIARDLQQSAAEMAERAMRPPPPDVEALWAEVLRGRMYGQPMPSGPIAASRLYRIEPALHGQSSMAY